MQICPACGEENPSRFRLCGFCGAPLAVAPAHEVRKTVTIVFSDLKGSTSLGESLDSEALREVMTRYFDTMRAILERHGGTIEKFIGDAIMAVFGLPRLHEDDALRAVRAAAEMQAALAQLNEELRDRWGVALANRTGVNTGEVVAGDPTTGQRLVTGDAVNVAARLEQAAGENEVLLGEPTYRLVRAAVEVEPVAPLDLKGKAEPVPAYRLGAVRAGEAIARRLDAPMVGREDELARMLEAYETVRREGAARLVTIVGEAGVGKSRLIRELADRAGHGATILHGRCLSYGEGITYWALSGIVRQAAGIGEDDSVEVAKTRLAELLAGEPEAVDRIAGAIGLSVATYEAADTTWAARRLLEIVAAERPTIVHVEDVHWAEPTLLDLVEGVVRTAAAPILVLCSTRHDLFESRPSWGEALEGSTRIDLGPLDAADADRIVEHLLGGGVVPDRLRARITRAAGGHPLYVEQYLGMLLDEGHLRREESGWVLDADEAGLDVPPSISALLTARVDRLDADERAVIEPASVVGLDFGRAAVEVMAPEPVRPSVGALLHRVVGRHLVRPSGDGSDDASFSFLHALIREATYGGLLKRARAELHERFADFMERTNADRLLEVEEILGYHLEQAHRYRDELGPLDDAGRALGARAAVRLASAGQRAFARGDMPAASNLLRRALKLVPADDPRRPVLLGELAEAQLDLGELDAARGTADEAIGVAEALGDRRLVAAGTLVRLLVHYVTDADGWSDRVEREVARLVPGLEELGDDANLSRAFRLLGSVHGTACHYADAERAVERAIDHARLAGDARQEVRNLPAYATSALYGPTPVPRAIERCRELLRQAPGDLRAEGIVRCTLAHLHAMAGEVDTARDLYREGRERFERLGGPLLVASTSLDSGRAELLAGDPDRALAELVPDHDALEAMGERYLRSTIAGLIGRAHLDRGDLEAADRFAQSCRTLAAPDDIEAQVLWRGIRARTVAAGRAADPADDHPEVLATEAIELTRTTDSPVLQAAALTDRGHVLAELGRRPEAEAAWAEAAALHATKGNVAAGHALTETRAAAARTGVA